MVDTLPVKLCAVTCRAALPVFITHQFGSLLSNIGHIALILLKDTKS